MADEYEDVLAEPADDEQRDDAEREMPELVGGGFMDSLQDQFGSAPWWVISAVTHAVILMLLATIVMVYQQPTGEAVVVEQLPPPPKPPEKIKRKIRDIVKSDKIVEVDADLTVQNPVIIHDKIEITDNIETESDLELNTAPGEEEAISDIPLGGTGFSGVIGIGGGGAGAYGFRTGGGRKHAAMLYGGSPATESAVDRALAWLARNQEADGRWELKKHDGKAPETGHVGLTGLAVLAFLGAGHTEKDGRYQENVRRGVTYLISVQDNQGSIGHNDNHKSSDGAGYNHGMAGLALAEAWGMGKVKATGFAAQKAIDYTCNKHQKPNGGWRYDPRETGDLSVTGWFVMQLKSAKVAGLNIPPGAFRGAMNFLDQVEVKEDNDGDYGGGFFKYTKKKSHWDKDREKARICSMGMISRLFLGFRPNTMLGGAQLLKENAPKRSKPMFYYWYYGTLVMFQVGGDHWKTWNDALRPTLVNSQERGGDEDGSWDPKGKYGEKGGRVMTTAMGALCLEVYYRYLPMYK